MRIKTSITGKETYKFREKIIKLVKKLEYENCDACGITFVSWT